MNHVGLHYVMADLNHELLVVVVTFTEFVSCFDQILAVHTHTLISDAVGNVIASFVLIGGDAAVNMLCSSMSFDLRNLDGLMAFCGHGPLEMLPQIAITFEGPGLHQ